MQTMQSRKRCTNSRGIHRMETIKRFTKRALPVILITIGVVILLAGCATKVKPTNTATNTAKETIEHIVKKQPECAGVGEVCIKQIDMVNAICDQEITATKDEAYKNGRIHGVIITMAILCFIAFGLKVIGK